jgi:hypothetical protein
MKEYIAQRSKAFAGGLVTAITTAVTMTIIHQAEKSFGIDSTALGTNC